MEQGRYNAQEMGYPIGEGDSGRNERLCREESCGEGIAQTPERGLREEELARAWESFAVTGRIGDYLSYKGMEAAFRPGER